MANLQRLMLPSTDKTSYVYILASKTVGTLYTGITSDLPARVAKHKAGTYEGFSKKYGVDKLVYYERHGSAEAAIEREKRLKKWRRAWKIQLIENANPKWEDLYPALLRDELGHDNSMG
jgi:putative endonuclease